jgi:hypothetical protein
LLHSPEYNSNSSEAQRLLYVQYHLL